MQWSVMMRYKAGHKDETHARLVAAAGRGFRKRGYGGIGVDGLAKEADVTSGAFYSHFKSKEDAFDEVIAAGIGQLKTSILALRDAHGTAWSGHYVDRYLGAKRTCDLAESCALQSLASEVGRSGARIKSTFQLQILDVAQAAADGFEGGTPEQRLARAWAFLAILSGGVTLARAVADPALAETMATGVRSAALQVVRSL
jgi:TetR/AcrR family transcriptional regulator, transcriptional repressor for nem operon